MLAFGLGPHAVAPTADGADLTVTLPAPEPVDLAPAGAPAVRAALRHWSFGEDPTLIKIKPPFVPGYEPVLGACGPQHDSTSLIFEIHYPIDGSVLREWVQTLGDALKKACLLLQDQNVGGSSGKIALGRSASILRAWLPSTGTFGAWRVAFFGANPRRTSTSTSSISNPRTI
jgi:hypothetical protein